MTDTNKRKVPRLRYWMGSEPNGCQMCGGALGGKFVDGQIAGRGSWACMCIPCHAELGAGLGTGRGQLYEWDSHEHKWMKKGG